MQKQCRVCGIEKDDSCFEPKRRVCIKCRTNQAKARRHAKPKKPRKPRTKMSEKERKNKQKQYYEKNRDLIIAKRKEYRLNNKERIASTAQRYYLKNRDKILEYHKQYRNDNKELRARQRRKYESEQMRINPNFKIRKNLRNAIYCALIRNESIKNKLSILKYLSYTIEELKFHLESQFEPWMNWDNWGVYRSELWDDNDISTWTWQIDHIIPHCEFKYVSMEDEGFKKCWALDNLRPYSAKQNNIDNARQKVKYDTLQIM